MGEPATHPELLDWLAVEFVENGWSLKHMHRLMVVSAAYRQDSLRTPPTPHMTTPARSIATTTCSGMRDGVGSKARRCATPCWPCPAN